MAAVLGLGASLAISRALWPVSSDASRGDDVERSWRDLLFWAAMVVGALAALATGSSVEIFDRHKLPPAFAGYLIGASIVFLRVALLQTRRAK